MGDLGAADVNRWRVLQRLLFDAVAMTARERTRGRHYTWCVTQQQADLIAIDPDIVGGQAHVRGTRIPVSVVLDCLAAGLSEDEIIEQCPSLTRDGIRAAAAYGAALAREQIFPLPA